MIKYCDKIIVIIVVKNYHRTSPILWLQAQYGHVIFRDITRCRKPSSFQQESIRPLLENL